MIMNKIKILVVALLFFNAISFAQTYPVNQTIGAPSNLVTSKGGFKSDRSLIMPYFLDTTKANISPYIKNYPGNLIRVGDSVYFRSSTANKWNLLNASGGGTTPTLQQVLTAGSTVTSNNVITGNTRTTIRQTGSNIRAAQFILDTSVIELRSVANPNLGGFIANSFFNLTPGAISITGTNGQGRSDIEANSVTAYMQYRSTPSSNFYKLGVDFFGFFFANGLNQYYFPLTTGATGQILKLTSPTQLAWANDSTGGSSTDTTSLSNRINQAFTSATKISDTSFFMSSPTGTNDTITLNGAPVYVESPIMARVSNDSNIIYFNADTANAWRGGGASVAVDTIFRTLGKDSIFYKKNNITYAIKDSVGTNPPPNGYYGAFQDTTTQTAASINTAYPVNLRVTDLSNGITISNNSKIKIANAGIYNIQFSLQLEKTGGTGNMIVDIWLRKNGVNIDGTTGKVVLTGSANASPIVAAWNYVVAVSSNDSLELMWSTNNDNVVIKAAPATSPHPSIPSSILTVTQQSGIMAGTGISPLDTANMLSPYQRKFLPANSIQGNNTSAAANATNIYFKDTSGTYTGTPVWSTSTPTGTTNHTYRWTRIGNMVTLNISLVYGTVSANNTTLLIPLPADCPTPLKPTGFSAASNYLYPVNNAITGNTVSALTNAAARGGLRSNSGNNGFELFFNFSPLPSIYFHLTITYYTN